MSITLTITQGRQSSVKVSAGAITYAGNFFSDRDATQASKRLGVPAEFIDAAVARFRADGVAEHVYTPPVAEDAQDEAPDLYRVRLITQPDSMATVYEDFADALEHAGATPDHIITWNDGSEVAALDWDWHTNPEYAPDDPETIALLATPRPVYAWKTRSGGLRMVYTRQGDVPADALAAVGAYSIYGRLSPNGLELKTDTRFPPDRDQVVRLAGDSDLTSLAELFNATTFNVADRDDYLTEQGLVVGRRYSHEHCPIDATRNSNSPDPVQVLEDGVKCYSCGAYGFASFRSWSQILGRAVATEVSTCVDKFTHFEHARFILEKFIDFKPAMMESFYKAALIVKHGHADARIPSVFRHRDLVRFSGYWGTLKAQPRRDDRLKFTIAGLPAVMGPDGKIDNERHERFLDSADLHHWGYYPLKQVHGMKISTRFIHAPDGRPRIEICEGAKPEYLEPAARMSEEEAWSLFEAAYPGVRRNLIELLVFARGLVEYGTTNAPMFLLEGASGSGKSGSPQLAAAICGDRCRELIPQQTEERLYSHVIDALRSNGTFMSLSEVVKAARKFRVQPRDYMNFLLHITPNSVGHVLYKGPVQFGDVPVLCVSDTEFTEEVLSDTQLGRRLFYYDLGTEYNDWKQPPEAAGLTARFAVRSTEAYQRASDSLLSIWIDRYWQETPPPTLDDVAKSLGIGYLNSRSGSADRADLMKQLYDAWKKYAGATGSYRDRQSKGFKAFKIDPDKVQLARIWVQLHDDGSPTTWSRANERSWQQVTGHPKPLKLAVKRLYDDRENWVQLSFQEQEGTSWNAIA